jgi:nucleotide-binding universal stress UspA family protein
MNGTTLGQDEGELRPAPRAQQAPYRRLLVPLDGSELSEQALGCARSLAALVGGDLILARAASARPAAGEPAQGEKEAVAEAEVYLERLAATLRPGLPVELSVPVGDPADQLAQVAASHQVDLIVMSTHGRSGLRRMMLGSVATALLQRTRLPILLVRAGLGATAWSEAPRRILVPLDGTEQAERALGPVGDLARLVGAELTLLEVVGLPLPVAGSYDLIVTPESDATLAEQARSYLAEQAAALRARGLTVRTEVLIGGPAAAIVETAAAGQHDLIAMATHARGGFDRLLLGSVADDVLRNAQAPVLLLRA